MYFLENGFGVCVSCVMYLNWLESSFNMVFEEIY